MSQSHQIIIVTGWLLSIVALVVTIAVVMRIIKKREKTESTVPMWIVYAIGIFVTAFILVLSQNIVDLGGTPDAPNILDSLLSSLQMFVLGRGIDLNIEMLEWMGPFLLIYAVYNAALFLAVPAATAGTVISLIGQMLSVPRMLSLARKRGVHVFSELNEKSLTLAKSVYEDEGTAEHLVVFANVRDDDVALASDAKSAGMVCLAQSVSFIASRIGSRSFKRTYVFSSDDEVSNLGNGITLARQLVEQHVVGDPTPYVFMFSSSPVAGAVVDAVSSEVNASLGENADASDIKVRLKRVDWIRNTVDMLLDTYPLFATGLDEGCMDGLEFEPKLTFDYEPSKRHILIVGESMFAVEYLKGVLWAGQFGDEIEVQIDVVTPGVETLKRRFAFESPEFFATDGRPYQDRYNLRFYSFDPQGDDYLNYLLESGSEFGEIDQVLVAIDDDLVCAKVARRTREILEQRRLCRPGMKPAFIAALIEDSELAQAVRLMKARKRLYAIEPVGDVESAYTVKNVFNTPLSRQARNVNRIYSEHDINAADNFEAAILKADLGFMGSEYSQRSSLASALHRKYSLFLVCRKTASAAGAAVDWTTPLVSIDQVVKDEYEAYFKEHDAAWLSAVEHDRWSAYVSTEGHEHADLDQVKQIWALEEKHNYELAHLHPCLIDFDDLPSLDNEVEAVKGASPQFQKIDDNVIRAIGVIAADKNTFEAEWKRFFGSKG